MYAFTTTERPDLNTAIMHLLSMAELASRLTVPVGCDLLDRSQNYGLLPCRYSYGYHFI